MGEAKTILKIKYAGVPIFFEKKRWGYPFRGGTGTNETIVKPRDGAFLFFKNKWGFLFLK